MTVELYVGLHGEQKDLAFNSDYFELGTFPYTCITIETNEGNIRLRMNDEKLLELRDVVNAAVVELPGNLYEAMELMAIAAG